MARNPINIDGNALATQSQPHEAFFQIITRCAGRVPLEQLQGPDNMLAGARGDNDEEGDAERDGRPGEGLLLSYGLERRRGNRFPALIYFMRQSLYYNIGPEARPGSDASSVSSPPDRDATANSTVRR